MIDSDTNQSLQGSYVSLVSYGPDNLFITVPAGLNDNDSVNLQIVYKLDDVAGTTFTQDLMVEFLAPDYCNQATIYPPSGIYQSFFAFEEDVMTSDYYTTGTFSTDIDNCGPLVYEIDGICSQFISVTENLDELIFTYN